MPLTDEQKQDAAHWRRQGLGGRLIARAIGAPYGQVRRWLEKNPGLVIIDGQPLSYYVAQERTAMRKGPPTLAEAFDKAIKEQAGRPLFRAVCFDLECTNLKTDLGTLLCAAFHDMYTRTTVSKSIDDFGDLDLGEQRLALWIKEQIVAADVVIGFNSQGFDHHYVNGVLTRYGLPTIPKRIIIDLYQSARYGWTGLPSSYSLRNLSHFFRLSDEKQSMDKDVWRQAATSPNARRLLKRHCERDVEITALLWEKIKGFHFEWRGR